MKNKDVLSGLVGIRYLTPGDLTVILEYYRNGPGFGREDLKNLVGLVNKALGPKPPGPGLGPGGGPSGALLPASQRRGEPLLQAKPQRDYIYFRASQKEPFDILYLTPAISTVWNLEDRSFTLIPELLYSPMTNLELRLRGAMLFGGSAPEYGNNQNDFRVEFRARYFF